MKKGFTFNTVGHYASCWVVAADARYGIGLPGFSNEPDIGRVICIADSSRGDKLCKALGGKYVYSMGKRKYYSFP